jgi:hypothetical protein
MIRRVNAIPATMKRAEPTNDVHILAHSETGHHHVIESRSVDRFIDETNQFISYISVMSDAEITHMREHDTHEALGVEGGAIYEVRNQREYTPEGWRRAAD